MIFGLLLIIVIPNGYATIKAKGAIDYDDCLLYSHLIFRGIVMDISYGNTTFDEWRIHSGGRPEIVIKMATIRISVTEVLKGLYENEHISISILRPHPGFLESGDNVIVSAFYNPGYKGGNFILRALKGLFVFQNGKWINQSDQQAMTTREIKDRIETTKIEHVAREAEVILVGKIVSKCETTLIGPNGESGRLEEYTISIDSVLKGNASSSELTFSMLTGGGYTPPWRRRVPTELSEGEVWYVFLKKGEIGYYPFAGTNGLLRVEGKILIYDLQVNYPYSKIVVDELVAEAVKGEH